MLGFKQYITEGWTDEVDPSHIHYNVTPRQLMRLAKQHGSTRFCINKKDRFNAGNARHVTHGDLKDETTSIYGGMTYDKEKNKHYYTHEDSNHDSNDDNDDHPLFKELNKLGCIKGDRRGDLAAYRVVDEQYITESKLHWGEDADSPVYENPSKSHLKALSKEGVIGWRWLQQGKKIYVGNASHYIHDDIATAVGIKASMENPIRGGMSSVERLAKDGYDVTKGGRSMVEISRKNWILPPKKEPVKDEYGYNVDDNEWDGH